jgi:hypothetical protein
VASSPERGDPKPKGAGSSSAMKAIRQCFQQGSVVVITEGARDVAFFIIEQKTRR